MDCYHHALSDVERAYRNGYNAGYSEGYKQGEDAHRLTNAASIRSMTDEELADFESSLALSGPCPPGADVNACIDDLYAHGKGPYPEGDQCRKCWLEWLREEADDA